MKNIVKIAILAAALLSAVEASAQLRTAYFMNGSTQRYDMNPALSPTRGFISLPVVGSTYASLETNFLSAENFLYPNGEGNGLVTYMHKNVSAEEFLSRLPEQNNIELGLNTTIFSMGNYFRGGFWSIGVRMRSETNLDIPKEFFSLTKTLSQGTYDIAGMGIQSTNFLEASLGYTFPVQDVFTLGFRAKMLVGLANISARIDKMDIAIGRESYSAQMAGTLECNVAGYSFEEMSGQVTLQDYLNHIVDFTNFDPLRITSVGFAVDAGIEWTFRDEQIRLSAAVNDLGYNAWGTNSSFCATIDNVNFAFNGYDLQNNEVRVETPESIALVATPEKATAKTNLHTSIVAGLEYNFLGERMSLGALWNMKMYDTRKWNSISGALTIRPTRWITASASYSYVNTLGVLGVAANIHSRLCNLFVGVDYIATKFGTANGGAIPVPINQNSLNLAFGLSLPLGARMF